MVLYAGYLKGNKPEEKQGPKTGYRASARTGKGSAKGPRDEPSGGSGVGLHETDEEGL